MYWNLIPSARLFGGGAFGRLRWRALLMGLVPLEETPESSLILPTKWGHRICRTSQTWELWEIDVWCLSCPAHGYSLQQPEWTKTYRSGSGEGRERCGSHEAHFSHPQWPLREDHMSLTFYLCPGLILVAFLEESVTSQSRKVSQVFKAKSKPIQILEYKLKNIICQPDTFFQVYISFGSGTDEGMFHSESEGLKKNSINMNDVYNVLLTFLVSETQTLEWLLTLQTAFSLCKWFATGHLWVMSSLVHSARGFCSQGAASSSSGARSPPGKALLIVRFDFCRKKTR